MSNTRLQIAYDGTALSGHTMDVHLLAPALMGFGDLCREANRVINGNSAEVSVHVRSDFENKCFLVNFEIHQTLLDQVRQLLGNADVSTAKELLEWIGLFGSFGLFQFLRKTQAAEGTVIEDHSRSGTVVIQIDGDNNSITLDRRVYALSRDPRVIEAAQAVVRPVISAGINSLEFRTDDVVTERLDRADAESILSIVPGALPATPATEPQIVTANLRAIGVEFDDENPGKWKFWWGDQKIRVDVSGTSIPRDYMARGVASSGDIYRVRMEITERMLRGRLTNEYKILNVERFIPGPRQVPLPFPPTEEN